jgi:subtilisin family serine protease
VACAALLWLAGCGGGDDGTPLPAKGPEVTPSSPSADPSIESRRFVLWDAGGAAAIVGEQLALEPTQDGSTVRLIVRLNPAAVFPAERRAVLGTAGPGEAGDEDARRERQRAAQAQAVAVTAQSVLSRSVLAVAPAARIEAQFSQALEGFVMTVPIASAEAVAEALAHNPAVDGVEPDRTLRAGQTGPTSPTLRTLDARAWGVDRIDQRTPALDGAFRQSLTGRGVNVYVVDSGVSPHNEFGSRLVAGFSSVNDGRGTTDCSGHGTHVAGTAAGATLGVAPGATVVPVRVMGCNGSSSGSTVLAGLDWVASRGQRPAVVNLSLGGEASATLDAAVQRLMTLGFTVAVSAGNDNADACRQSPARTAGAITVAASDRADAKAAFSNWGACVTLWAPGAAIAAAGHAQPTAVVTMNGTSMAAPHAAGAAALLLQADPTLAPARVRERLMAQATPGRITTAPGSMTRSLLYAGLESDVPGTTVPTTPPSTTPPVATPPVATATATHIVVRDIALSTQVPSVGTWRAVATLDITDNQGRAVSGARVGVRFSHSSSEVTCTSSASGACTVQSANANWQTVTVMGMAVSRMQTTGLPWTGGGVVRAQVSRPDAPKARITALTGTMVRSSPAAVNWTPQFTVTVQDEKGAPVNAAAVQVLMQVHSGPRVAVQKSVSCNTAANGQCRLTWNGQRLDASHTGAVVKVESVKRNFLVYSPGTLTQASVGMVR